MGEHFLEEILKSGAPAQFGVALAIVVGLVGGGLQLLRNAWGEGDYGNVFLGVILLAFGILGILQVREGLQAVAEACSHLAPTDPRVSEWGCKSVLVSLFS